MMANSILRASRSALPAVLGIFSTCCILAVAGCTLSAGARVNAVEVVPNDPVVYVDAAPENIDTYPVEVYGGVNVYYVDGRWYHQDAGRWAVYSVEPVELARRRAAGGASYHGSMSVGFGGGVSGGGRGSAGGHEGGHAGGNAGGSVSVSGGNNNGGHEGASPTTGHQGGTPAGSTSSPGGDSATHHGSEPAETSPKNGGVRETPRIPLHAAPGSAAGPGRTSPTPAHSGQTPAPAPSHSGGGHGGHTENGSGSPPPAHSGSHP